MTERTYAVVSLDELDRFPAMTGAPVLLPLRRRLDVRAFGINCWTAPVGESVIERHREPEGDEEVYIVVRGLVRFTIGEENIELGRATVVYVPPDTTREAVALEPETLVIAVGGRPGEAFEPKSWEDFQVAFAQAQARGDDEARALLAEALARDPGAWQPAYNAACFEALTGNADERLRAPRPGTRARSGPRADAGCGGRGTRGAAIGPTLAATRGSLIAG